MWKSIVGLLFGTRIQSVRFFIELVDPRLHARMVLNSGGLKINV